MEECEKVNYEAPLFAWPDETKNDTAEMVINFCFVLFNQQTIFLRLSRRGLLNTNESIKDKKFIVVLVHKQTQLVS